MASDRQNQRDDKKTMLILKLHRDGVAWIGPRDKPIGCIRVVDVRGNHVRIGFDMPGVEVERYISAEAADNFYNNQTEGTDDDAEVDATDQGARG